MMTGSGGSIIKWAKLQLNNMEWLSQSPQLKQCRICGLLSKENAGLHCVRLSPNISWSLWLKYDRRTKSWLDHENLSHLCFSLFSVKKQKQIKYASLICGENNIYLITCIRKLQNRKAKHQIIWLIICRFTR